MRVLRRVTFDDALADWGSHEGRGLLFGHFPREAVEGLIRELDGPQGRERAIRLARDIREPLVRPIEAAGIQECHRVELGASDFPSLRALEGRVIEEHATRWLARPDTAGAWVRELTEREPIAGPLLLVGRRLNTVLTVFDGNHRIAAWVSHIRAGRAYGLTANVVLTERPVIGWEAPWPVPDTQGMA